MTDAKIATLYENHKQAGSIKHLPEKIETWRKNATLYGLGASLSIFFANELARFTLRTPLFKLRPVQVIVAAALPTGFLRYSIREDIDNEVAKFWRIHKTREEKGLGGSYTSTGVYDNQPARQHLANPYPIPQDIDNYLLGTKVELHTDHGSMKLNDGITDYNHFHDDWDKDLVYTELEHSDRVKKYQGKPEDFKHGWFMQSLEDTDQKPNWGGIDNDNPFHEPFDSNMGPAVDHKQDERQIFAFKQTPYNTEIFENMWKVNPDKAVVDRGAPWWSDKLFAVSYQDTHSYEELIAQMNSRNEFNFLKAKWALHESSHPSAAEDSQQTKELQDFVDHSYEEKALRDLKGVYVTDHSPNPKKLHTNNEAEDLDFFNYEQKLREFHANSGKALPEEEQDFTHPIVPLLEEAFRLKLQAIKEEGEDFEEDEDTEEEDKLENKEFIEEDVRNDLLQNKLGPFKEGDEYSYIEDMLDAYKKPLSQSLKDQIFDKIPDHQFWDIKTPQIKTPFFRTNTYNPAKPRNAYTFFEHRHNWEYLQEKHKYSNLTTSIGKSVRY